ncbi:MAG: spore germination protein [Bacillota bacterium]
MANQAEKTLIASNLAETLQNIKDRLGNPADLRIIHPMPGSSGLTAAVYFNGLVNEGILFGQMHDLAKMPPDSAHFSPATSPSLEAVLADMSKGYALFLIWEQGQCLMLAMEIPGWQLRPIAEPKGETLIRGPREGFTETISVNTAMIRRWISDPGLRIEEIKVGTRTKTSVELIYLSGVANPALVRNVRERIGAIKVDGILDSGYIEQLITDNNMTLFPLIQSTERPDKAVAGILEGRVAVLVDKSPFALIVPVTINEFYQSPEDYYFGFYLGSFLRLLRLLGNNIAVAFPGLYIALASFNPELLPTNFAYTISESRRGIPYPIFVEVLILEIIVEIFREAGLRLPRTINITLGVVTGVAVAFAAVHDHLVSGTSLVVVSITAIAAFSTPDFSISIPWRILKFIMIISASAFGIVGLTISGVFILGHAATLESFGTSFLAPWGPMQPAELRDTVFRIPLWLRIKRPRTYHPINRKRMEMSGGEKEEEDAE